MKKGYFVCTKEALQDILFHTIDNNWKRQIQIDDIKMEQDAIDPEYFFLRIDVSGDDLPDECNEKPERLRFKITKDVLERQTLLPADVDKKYEDRDLLQEYNLEILMAPPEFR